MNVQDMDWQTAKNLLNGIADIVDTSQKQHNEEINLIKNQHKEVVQELLKQAQSTEANHKEAIKEARKQVKYARLAFYVALIALGVTICLGVLPHLHCR